MATPRKPRVIPQVKSAAMPSDPYILPGHTLPLPPKIAVTNPDRLYQPTTQMYPFDVMSRYSHSTQPQQANTNFLQSISQQQSKRLMYGIGGFILAGYVWKNIIHPSIYGIPDDVILPDHLQRVADRNRISPDKPAVNPNRLPWGGVGKTNDQSTTAQTIIHDKT